jgi:hypothetical protein
MDMTFKDIQKLKEFIASRPALQEIGKSLWQKKNESRWKYVSIQLEIAHYFI